MLVVACGGAETTGKRAQESIPRADQTGAPLDAIASATEFPSLPLPTATPPPQTCDPVQRARLTRFENVSLPASNPLSDSFRSIILPAAWLIVDGTAVSGTSAVFQCAPLEPELFPCPDDPALNCSNSTLHVDWVQDIGAPKDHSRVSAVGPLAGKRFEILVDTSDIEFFASTLVPWNDEITSGFGPEATKLSPQLASGETSNLYRFPPLPELTPGVDYLLTVRLEFIGDNEITYLWRLNR